MPGQMVMAIATNRFRADLRCAEWASSTTSALWVLIASIAAATFFSLFQVPYIALPAELTDSYGERTRLLTWRVVMLTVAILLFGAGAPRFAGSS